MKYSTKNFLDNKSLVCWLNGIILMLSSFSPSLWAANDIEGYSLVLSPKQCVAMRQGQTCYVDVELQWQSKTQGDFCLYSSQVEQPLQCWQDTRLGRFEREIVAKDNVIFVLKSPKNALILATTKLEMAWVYKKNIRANSWRMF